MTVEPFEIYALNGMDAGQIALCRQPGQSGDLTGDMAVIAAWAPTAVVTLTQEAEFPDPPTSLPIAFTHADYDWLHLPIIDFGTPAARDAALFDDSVAALHDMLAHGGRILIHCKGGKGRSGMLALRLMVAQDEPPEQALARLRAVRAGAVETDQQYVWASNNA